MSGGLVDDYLSQLLGAAAAGTMAGDPAPPASPPSAVAPAAPPPEAVAPTPPAVEAALPTSAVAPEPAVTVSTPPPANPDEITEDEFEALLDALHGSAPPGAVTPAPAAAPPAPKPPANPDEITEDEFEALLDALHGGAPPGAVTPAAPPAAKPAATPAGGGDEITEDEFEALLDTLHGGKPPGAVALAANVAVAAARATAAPAARPSPAAEPAEAPAAADEGDDWRGQERRASRRSSRWLRIRVHGQDYGVELLKVQEVLLPVGVLPMRDTDAAILGVMNLRGVVVPVLDLGLWLGLEEVEDSAQTRYVVLEQNGDCLALKVSAVLDVHAIADGQVEPAENTLAAPGSAMLRGVTRLNSQPVILLDAVGLLG